MQFGNQIKMFFQCTYFSYLSRCYFLYDSGRVREVLKGYIFRQVFLLRCFQINSTKIKVRFSIVLQHNLRSNRKIICFQYRFPCQQINKQLHRFLSKLLRSLFQPRCIYWHGLRHRGTGYGVRGIFPSPSLSC